MLLQKYITKISNRGNDFVAFEFAQLEGRKDFGLLQAVFSEFIKYPILRSLELGLPIIKIARAPILNKIIDVSVVENEEANVIKFQLRGKLLKNKILSRDEIDMDNDANFYLQMNSGNYLVLENIPANSVGTVLSMMFLIDWLDGMPVDVEYDEYIPTCANCVFNKECMVKYIHLLDALNVAFINDKEGCILGEKAFGEKKPCENYYVRDTYPDLGEIRDVLADFR